MPPPRPLHTATLAVCSCLGVVAAWTLAQPDAASTTPATQVEADAAGAEHARLVALVGSWTSSTTLEVPDEAAPVQAVADAASVRIEAMLDGRFVCLHETGSMLGEAFTGMKIFGYNNAAGLYEATWLYTGSTATMRMRGTPDEHNPSILSFQAQYATGPDEHQRFLVTMNLRGSDEFRITLTALLPDGSAGPSLYSVYTRQR